MSHPFLKKQRGSNVFPPKVNFVKALEAFNKKHDSVLFGGLALYEKEKYNEIFEKELAEKHSKLINTMKSLGSFQTEWHETNKNTILMKIHDQTIAKLFLEEELFNETEKYFDETKTATWKLKFVNNCLSQTTFEVGVEIANPDKENIEMLYLDEVKNLAKEESETITQEKIELLFNNTHNNNLKT